MSLKTNENSTVYLLISSNARSHSIAKCVDINDLHSHHDRITKHRKLRCDYLLRLSTLNGKLPPVMLLNYCYAWKYKNRSQDTQSYVFPIIYEHTKHTIKVHKSAHNFFPFRQRISQKRLASYDGKSWEVTLIVFMQFEFELLIFN